MQVFNESACSREFIGAVRAVMAGGTARRPSWVATQVIKLGRSSDTIAVFRGDTLVAPHWTASGDEQSANDWITALPVEVPKVPSMIPAASVQRHLQAIVKAASENGDAPALRAALVAADDLGLLAVNARAGDGAPLDVTWLLVPRRN